MKKWWGEWGMSMKLGLLFIALVLLLCYGMFKSARDSGYKEGQIDYALNRIEYTVIEGKVIHIMGDAPGPEIKLSPIEEKGK